MSILPKVLRDLLSPTPETQLTTAPKRPSIRQQMRDAIELLYERDADDFKKDGMNKYFRLMNKERVRRLADVLISLESYDLDSFIDDVGRRPIGDWYFPIDSAAATYSNPGDFIRAIEQVPGPWTLERCDLYTSAWSRFTPRTMREPGDTTYRVSDFTTQKMVKYLRFIQQRNANALLAPETLRMVRTLEDDVSNATHIHDPEKVRTALREFRDALGYEQSQEPAFPTTNTQKRFIKFENGDGFDIDEFQTYMQQVKSVRKQLHDAARESGRKALTVDVLQMPDETIRTYGEYFKLDHWKPESSTLLQAVPEAFNRTTEEVLTPSQIIALHKQRDKLEFEHWDFSADAPPCPKLLTFADQREKLDAAAELTQHLAIASGTRPTKTWRTKVQDTVDQLGASLATERFDEWLRLLVEHRHDPRANQKRLVLTWMYNAAQSLNYSRKLGYTANEVAKIAFLKTAYTSQIRVSPPSLSTVPSDESERMCRMFGGETLVVSKTNIAIARGVIWTLEMNPPKGFEALLRDITIEMSKRVFSTKLPRPAPICRSYALACCCVHTLERLQTPTARKALDKLATMDIEDRVLQKIQAAQKKTPKAA
ncbi:hypothetical protein [Ahrensia sp. R2A130]|uniref:hypothetical protein n=1 Tax=Ahrensia sp. R2A130 TaxID=744979 RepID=UPI0001E0F095|nr:hypothetical protein [Ahrensia sp. R2A130]EFL89892.1 hypothetical protein R2A130_2504 [Ahrensia sp. R2A130]